MNREKFIDESWKESAEKEKERLVEITQKGSAGSPEKGRQPFRQDMNQDQLTRSLDARTPRATITQPANNASVTSPLKLVATTSDSDIAVVQFQYHPPTATSGSGGRGPIGKNSYGRPAPSSGNSAATAWPAAFP